MKWAVFSIPFYCILLILFLSPALLRAETLTLEQAISRVLDDNPDIASAEATLKIAASQARLAKQERLTKFNVTTGYTRLSDVDPFTVDLPVGSITVSEPVLDVYFATLSAQQPLFTGYRISSQLEIAKEQQKQSEEYLESTRQELTYRMIEAYYRLVQSRKAVVVIMERLRALEAHVQDVENYYKTGLVTHNDLLQSQVLLSSIRIQLRKAQTWEQQAQIQVLTLLNQKEPLTLSIDETIDTATTELEELEELTEEALNNRPEIRAARSCIVVTEQAIRLAKSAYYPTVMATGSFNYANPNQRYQPLKDEFHGDWSVGIMATITPYDWGRRKENVALSKAQQEQQTASLRSLEQAIRSQVHTAWVLCNDAIEQLQLVLVKESQATEALRVAQDQFNNGLLLNSELLDSEAHLLEARLELTEARISYHIKRAYLNRTIGKHDE